MFNQGLLEGPFYPNSLSGAAIWLDANDLSTITKDGSNLVSQWNNKGNAGVGNATQGTDANKPKYLVNSIGGLPALRGRHDGAIASQLSIPDNAGLKYTQYTEYAVIIRNADLGVEEWIASKYESTGNQREHGLYVAPTDAAAARVSNNGSGNNSATLATNSTLTGVPYILQGMLSGSTVSIMQNGTTTATTTMTGTIFNGTALARLFSFSTGLTVPFDGYIGEYIFYNRALNTDERLQVSTYLSKKWTIAIS